MKTINVIMTDYIFCRNSRRGKKVKKRRVTESNNNNNEKQLQKQGHAHDLRANDDDENDNNSDINTDIKNNDGYNVAVYNIMGIGNDRAFRILTMKI